MQKIVFILILFLSTAFSATNLEPKVISDLSRKAFSVHFVKNPQGIPVIYFTEQATDSEEKFFSFAFFDKNKGDFGKKMSIPVPLSAALHTEGMPKLGFKQNGVMFAVYQVKVESAANKRAGEIHYIVSEDQGKTWSSPAILHQNRQADQGRGFFDITTLADGEIGVIWLGESNEQGGRPVRFAKTNAKNQFSDEVVVDDHACQCCRTSLYTDSKGNIFVMYRDITGDSVRDISLSISRDQGKTFDQPVCFSGDQWKIQGCPHNGGDVVSNGEKIGVTWFTASDFKQKANAFSVGSEGAGIYYAELDFKKKVLNKKRISESGRHIQLDVLDKKQNVLVYNRSEKNQAFSPIFAQIMPSGKEVRISAEQVNAKYPVVLALENGEYLSAWLEERNGIDLVVYRLPKSL